MVRCEHCGAECALPFTCQHCGGRYCPDCRLPPNHACAGIGSWNAKPRPSVGVNYGKGGVRVTGGGDIDSRRGTKKKPAAEIPYLWIMIAVIGLLILGLAWLVFSGYKG
jgi:hypothetical protein